MKTKKKTPEKINNIDDIIFSGKAEVEDPAKSPKGPGRPKSKVKKKQSPFYLSENIVHAIDKNCRGNKSVFAEEVFKFYFDKNKIDY
ncbi:MAG: hypothetical protein KKD05_06275 [Candidatus Omnitrophica bacterium]|nr:hypothetical protein [Candidatus Omnitrophota bacterium]